VNGAIALQDSVIGKDVRESNLGTGFCR